LAFIFSREAFISSQFFFFHFSPRLGQQDIPLFVPVIDHSHPTFDTIDGVCIGDWIC
jgi:hypothetical protein